MGCGPGFTAWTNQDVGIAAPEPGAVFETSWLQVCRWLWNELSARTEQDGSNALFPDSGRTNRPLCSPARLSVGEGRVGEAAMN